MFPLRNRLKSYLKDTVSSYVSSKSYRRRQHHPGYTPYSEHTRYQAITATLCTINHRHAPNLSSIEATQEHRVWLACSVRISLIMLINALVGPIDDPCRPPATLNAVLPSPIATQAPIRRCWRWVGCAHVRGSQRRLVPFWPGCCRDCRYDAQSTIPDHVSTQK